ncbi:hypothetical protein EGW08_017634 [Elysia chlorotica]|uniref:Uncharacterized protein n=1 Tax=Elysia chlorotica TaxID=188477 RepID=A0A433SZA2_ELYCH|nr:hypothetical protein EGW08_017634 [Elysia chlorotica]
MKDMFPDNNQQQICECETMKEPKEPVGEKPEMSIPYEEESVLTTNTDLPKELNSEKERVSKVNTHPSCSTFDEDQMETDDVSKKLANSDNVTSDSLEEHLIRTDRNENHSVSTPEENRENVTGGGLDFNSSTIQASNAFVATADDKNSIISTHIPSAGVKQVISSENKHILSSTESEICELLKENYNQPPDSSDEVERDKSHCQFYSESYQIQSTTNLQDNSLCTTANKTPVTKICDKCTVDDQFKHSSCPLLQSSNPTLTVQKSGVADTVSCISHENNNVLDTETVDKRIFEEDKSENSSIVDRDQYEEDPLKGCSYIEEEALSSYKQHSNDQMEVDNESYDEETGRAFVSPSIYQSYEENPLSAHFQTSDKNESLVVCPIIAEYNTCSGESSVSSPELRPPVSINNVEILLPNASAHTQTSTHNILNETAESFLPSGVLTSSTSSSKASVSLSISSSEEASQIFGLAIDEHEGALCTGDQNFKTSAACQTPLVPLMHSNQTCPTVSCVNQPAFKAVMNRGIPQQTLLTSALHFAQHQARCNSVMGHHRASVAARSTVLQQHVGATAMFHQRTMTNDGRTLLLQQSTMTTSQGAVAQQALLQQRLAAQTVLHQTSISRHQAVQQSMLRLPGRQIVDATLYPKTQSTIIAGGANALTGQRLIQSGSQNQLMQHFARQRYLGGPIVPQQRRVQMVTGGPMRIKMAYPRWTLTMDSNT